MSKPIVCLDFDGVIHSYTSGWKGVAKIPDPPVPGVGAAILRLICDFKIAIYSSRSSDFRGRRAMRVYVRQIIRDACFADSDAMHTAWVNTQGKPADWIPWTAGDVNEAADWIFGAIKWPFFKPAALMTIDDRALTFAGDWSDTNLSNHAIWTFRPWNKRNSNSKSSGSIMDENPNAPQTLSTQPELM